MPSSSSSSSAAAADEKATTGDGGVSNKAAEGVEEAEAKNEEQQPRSLSEPKPKPSTPLASLFGRKEKGGQDELGALEGGERAAGDAGEEVKPANGRKKEKDGTQVPYRTLYRFATQYDFLLMAGGSLAAVVVGVSQPVMSLVFNNLMNGLILYPYSASPNRNDELRDTAIRGVVQLVVIGACVMFCAYSMIGLWNLAGERQTKRLREEYLAAILRQDVAWFDKTATGDLTTRLTADVLNVQTSISSKVGLIIMGLATFIAGFIIAFTKGPELAGVLCTAFPLLGATAFMMSKSLARRATAGTAFYAEAGAVAQEVIAAIRTVTAFHGQSREMDRYSTKLKAAEIEGVKSSMVSGLNIGFVFMIIFLTYALGFWYGGTRIGHGMTPGDVINVFFSIIIGAFSLGQVGPNLSDVASGIGAASKIFEVIDRKSPIDPSSEKGLKLESVVGVIEFKDVDFHYPQRPDVPVLKKFSLRILPGQTVALVGASGSGKSTIVKLITRFYDPVAGSITLDGYDIRDLNVTWLRQQIGLVGQEPVLFDKTVKENILYGMKDNDAVLGRVDGETVKRLDVKVKDVCKVANAWEFIERLPKGLDTSVGDAGGMMSGGQKQRIAIARAIMRDPLILLLDEATSALDTQSERVVQTALDNASKDRTTIVIAHRLSTIKHADLIVVMNEGEIVEKGKHDDLIATPNGSYASLVSIQALKEVDGGPLEANGGIEDDFLVSVPKPTSDETIKSTSASMKSAPSLPRRKYSATGSVSIDMPSGDNLDAVETEILAEDDMKTRILKRQAAERLKKQKEAAVLKRPMAWGRLYGMSAPEIPFYIVGVIASAGSGTVFPLFSLIFSTVLAVFGEPDETTRMNGVRFWALMFVALASAALASNSLSIANFGAAGERLTRRLRERAFAAILKQEMAFFDEPRHSTGALTSRLAEDATKVQGLVGRTMATLVSLVATCICGLTISFANGPLLSVIVLATVPFLAMGGIFQLRVMTGFGSKSKEAYEEASIIANEVIDQIRTVMTLTKEQAFFEQYKANIILPYDIAVKGNFLGAFGFGFSQGFIFFAYALAFYAGSMLVIAGQTTPGAVLKVMFAVIFTAVSLGQSLTFAPNYVEAKLSTFEIFDLLDRVSAIDPTDTSGEDVKKVDGTVKVQDAVFRYPSRPDVPVLQQLNLDAVQGKTLALVGPSGCGKSTVIALIERWYDVLGGSVALDGVNVVDWKIASLRGHLALVGQEPVLFNTSIRENIMYGAEGGVASDDMVIEAAKMANIHDFVVSLPQGYETVVGSKGGQLSGGQKQRVAIARALVRNPKVLLLDEATSALDSESEKVVQEALDAAAKGRTTIVIAHRLSTIQTADRIAVVSSGQVIEEGSFAELVQKGGVFAELATAQSLRKNE
ncbi:P-loop containing nucleoside triphosphate hydrolase protein [Zopfochytrium polystomum]|nr:P-loop containing nucleoside triphosphate hydrolase protein [Zopfochytrium polystomum]